MAIYLKYDGIDGEITEAKHTKWIECHSLQLGVGRGISTPVGSSAHRETSAPSVSEITITKDMDAASPKLFTESLTGTDGKTVQFHLARTGGKDGVIVYAEYKLTNALISGYSVSSGGDRPTESISLNFTKIEYKLTPFSSDNKAGTPVTVSYDLSTTKSA